MGAAFDGVRLLRVNVAQDYRPGRSGDLVLLVWCMVGSDGPFGIEVPRDSFTPAGVVHALRAAGARVRAVREAVG